MLELRGWRFAVPLAVALLAGLGCGSKPIPLAAVEGTTVAINLPSGFPVGFGRALYGDSEPPLQAQLASPPAFAPNSPLEDPQRGEMVFDLHDDTGAKIANLPLRYITRVNPSPDSRSAINNMISHVQGQVIAFVDIPMVITVDDWYSIRVHRYRRVVGAPNTYQVAPTPETSAPQLADWFGWGDDSVAPGTASSPLEIPIFIRDDASGPNYTPIHGWNDWPGTGLQYQAGLVRSELKDLVPYPAFELQVPKFGSPEPLPGAWRIEISYPKYLIRIRGVSLKRSAPSEAVLHWDADPPDAAVGCFALGGLLIIEVADPKQLTEGVKVAYELRNFQSPICGLRADETFFAESADSFQVWDKNGVDVTDDYDFHIVAASFF